MGATRAVHALEQHIEFLELEMANRGEEVLLWD